jgi:hypothetical protein
MIEYTCTWSLSDVSIWCYGAEIATHDDLECTLVLDGDCNLIAVRLPVDHVTGKTVEIDNRCLKSPAYLDANAQSIWRSALASVERSSNIIRDRADIPDVEIVSEALPYTDAAHVPVAGAVMWRW